MLDRHVAHRNLCLANLLGATDGLPEFPAFAASPAAEAYVFDAVRDAGLGRYYVLSPGGGWRSKCWPAERYGELHQRLAAQHGLRAFISYGPGEESLVETVRAAAGNPAHRVLKEGVTA